MSVFENQVVTFRITMFKTQIFYTYFPHREYFYRSQNKE